ncbi:MAG: ABC transporter permease [Desulfovibrio sp.]|jgi:phospholipid/cholesterol/gamma-HCH transport system permease protein|nr:ABC transporter permease [Desulfovibrio sp.]
MHERVSGSNPPFFSPVIAVGEKSIACLSETGAMAIFMLHGLRCMFSPSSKQWSKLIRQIYVIGAGSFFLIALISLFSGMVLGLQGYYTLSKFGSTGFLGSAVALTLIRELAPVLTAIMVTGRAGSAMAAEIGVMRITDQIDALEVMDISPMSYLVSPRIMASLIVFPLLTAIFTVVGILGGYVTGVMLLGINQGVYFSRIESSVVLSDIVGCFSKSLVFGLIVVTVCCHKGYFAHMRADGMGAEAVGNATTSAVVLSCILLLTADYVLTSVLL